MTFKRNDLVQVPARLVPSQYWGSGTHVTCRIVSIRGTDALLSIGVMVALSHCRAAVFGNSQEEEEQEPASETL